MLVVGLFPRSSSKFLQLRMPRLVAVPNSALGQHARLTVLAVSRSCWIAAVCLGASYVARYVRVKCGQRCNSKKQCAQHEPMTGSDRYAILTISLLHFETAWCSCSPGDVVDMLLWRTTRSGSYCLIYSPRISFPCLDVMYSSIAVFTCARCIC